MLRWIKRIMTKRKRDKKMAETATLERTNIIENKRARTVSIVAAPIRSLATIEHNPRKPIRETKHNQIPESEILKAEKELSALVPKAPSLSDISCISKTRVKENRKKLKEIYAKRPK